MEVVAQLVEHWIVAPVVAGSSPVSHPTFDGSDERTEGSSRAPVTGSTPRRHLLLDRPFW